jgi:hypothetical protein
VELRRARADRAVGIERRVNILIDVAKAEGVRRRRHDANLFDAGCMRAFETLEVWDQRVYRMESLREMPANTWEASAICGIHLGLTNAETSMTGRPDTDNLSTKPILSAVGIAADSFWSPSRGPTSPP